ncbi:MAG: coproporphyrinogen dehydrogenase HemZ [Clostridia bacterium]|nr:coproporphyrinogen dehydrogenase HemZ [Clostridia bacterium]
MENLLSLFFKYPKKAEIALSDEGGVCTATVSYMGKSAAASAVGNAETRALRAVWQACRGISGITPPWGILTGIRPDFVLRRLYDEGADKARAREIMRADYLVSESKISLMEETASAFERLASKQGEIAVYIGIPFCPTRCSYCSFISHDAVLMRRLEGEYTDRLCDEIDATTGIIKSAGLKIRSVYIGGGTPTALGEDNLARLLCKAQVLSKGADEFCVEAGRPDTINREKLEIIKSAGAGRICINPQTAKNETLQKIGRAHTWEDFTAKYKLAREVGFDNINCDLIAGLEDEEARDFEKSIDSLLSLKPDGVTVHALYVKRGSRAGGGIEPYSEDAVKMTEYALLKCRGAGLLPYYLYRQKKTVSNLENIGYAKSGRECIFNIDTMGDLSSVIALGAGGVTKLTDGARTERYSNFKNADLYISDFDKIIEKKKLITEFYENE